MAIRIIQCEHPLSDLAVRALRDRLRGGNLTAGAQSGVNVPASVRRIIADVQRRGDRAVVDWTNKLHGRLRGRSPATLFASPREFRAARASADEAFLKLIRRAARNIRQYQRRILIRAPRPIGRAGRELSVRYTPIDRVAVYVPGVRAMYPSTVLMTVVPAQVAGVGEIVIATPPGANGRANPLVLALAVELGVECVYCAAGVAGLAALAIGTKTVRPVDKIVGPGSAFIAEAKRQLLGRVGIDSMAGPSEVLIIADAAARADWLAADMLAQAEHDPGSAVLVTPSRKLALQVAGQIERQLPGLTRADTVRRDLDEYSAIIVVPNLRAACALANDFAAEHLQIVTGDDRAVLKRIRHAGAIFLGPHTPVPLGDYYAGPSHVLPTGGTARFFSALSANDFLKAGSLLRYNAAALRADAPDVADFARREGLSAHARAMEIREEALVTEARPARGEENKPYERAR